MAAVTVLLLMLSAAVLTAPAQCFTTIGGDDVTDCQPDIPPMLPNTTNASMVALQMHQWVWIENLTAPDWAQKTDSGGMFYEFLRPGFVRQQTLQLRTLYLQKILIVYVNTSFVTNGVTLCASALTQYRNRTSDALSSIRCNRICHENFTPQGTRANLPILIYDDWVKMSRFNEYLAFDAVDPESRAAYKCLGQFKLELTRSLPNYMNHQIQCTEGDECLFNNYKIGENYEGFVSAGCKKNFAEYNWCVSDINLCTFNIDGDCPICCRGDFCNLKAANQVYQRWINKGSPATATSLSMLAVSSFSILQLMKLS